MIGKLKYTITRQYILSAALSLWTPLLYIFELFANTGGAAQREYFEDWHTFSHYILYPMLLIWGGTFSVSFSTILVWKRVKGWAFATSPFTLSGSAAIVYVIAWAVDPGDWNIALGSSARASYTIDTSQALLGGLTAGLVILGLSFLTWIQYFVIVSPEGIAKSKYRP